MSNKNVLHLFNTQQKIFGLCPECGELFRLSEGRIFKDTPPENDWMERLISVRKKIDRGNQKLNEQESELRENARDDGRKQAMRYVKKIDKIFTPRKLNPDDAKVIFHPVDYVVFNGMKNKSLNNIVFLDRKPKTPAHKKIQQSIEGAISKGNIEWVTLRIEENGNIVTE
ncbi:MAG: hypothetical protein GX660_03365 [Clostridiaceae bacterium]|jgi:predicted Holliday junction resolvase-like endonuclease|nr:hypothetical protein [Clostridiaceae bacterium]